MKTKEDWWNVFVENRDALRRMAAEFYPIGAKSSPDVRITAPAAERIAEGVRETVAAALPDGAELIATATEPTPCLAMALSALWWGLPESEDIRGLDGFFDLCDLCSEAGLVLGEGEEFDEE